MLWETEKTPLKQKMAISESVLKGITWLFVNRVSSVKWWNRISTKMTGYKPHKNLFPKQEYRGDDGDNICSRRRKVPL